MLLLLHRYAGHCPRRHGGKYRMSRGRCHDTQAWHRFPSKACCGLVMHEPPMFRFTTPNEGTNPAHLPIFIPFSVVHIAMQLGGVQTCSSHRNDNAERSATLRPCVTWPCKPLMRHGTPLGGFYMHGNMAKVHYCYQASHCAHHHAGVSTTRSHAQAWGDR